MLWLLSHLPNWLFHGIVILGIVLYFIPAVIQYIPFISPYKRIVKLVGIILLLGGIWLEGGNYYYDTARAEIERIEKESEVATDKIKKEYEDKIAQTKQRGDTIVKYVDKFITKEADAKCVIPNSFVSLHNSAVHNQVPDTSRVADESPSGVALSTTTKTVVENYNTYHEVREQLLSLQKWINEQKKIRE